MLIFYHIMLLLISSTCTIQMFSTDENHLDLLLGLSESTERKTNTAVSLPSQKLFYSQPHGMSCLTRSLALWLIVKVWILENTEISGKPLLEHKLNSAFNLNLLWIQIRPIALGFRWCNQYGKRSWKTSFGCKCFVSIHLYLGSLYRLHQ